MKRPARTHRQRREQRVEPQARDLALAAAHAPLRPAPPAVPAGHGARQARVLGAVRAVERALAAQQRPEPPALLAALVARGVVLPLHEVAQTPL